MTAIVLAGGKATRMGGCNKAFLVVDGKPIINRQLKVLTKIFKEIIIITNFKDKYNKKWCLSLIKLIKIIPDVLPELGPLGGIYSGLLASKDHYNFVIACDTPFINERLIRYIKENTDGYDIIIPKINKRAHPLFGIYSRNCIPIIAKMLKRNRLKVSNIFPRVKTHFILKKEIERFDKKLLSLVNINTVEDLERARETRRSLVCQRQHSQI